MKSTDGSGAKSPNAVDHPFDWAIPLIGALGALYLYTTGDFAFESYVALTLFVIFVEVLLDGR